MMVIKLKQRRQWNYLALHWDHLYRICSQNIQVCNLHLCNLQATNNSSPRKTGIMLVTSLLSSLLDYCHALLIGTPKYIINTLQKILNKAVRFIYVVKRREHITPYLYQLHILSVLYRIKSKVGVIAYKIIQSSAPTYLNNKVTMFKPTNDKPRREGAGRDQLFVGVVCFMKRR
jgi:hypothetical protein